MFPESHGFVVCRLQAVSKIDLLIYHFLIIIVKGDEIVRPCDRYSYETVTLRKHVTEEKQHAKMHGRISQKIL